MCLCPVRPLSTQAAGLGPRPGRVAEAKPRLDVLVDNGLHLLDLAAGSALGGSGRVVDDLDDVVLGQAGAVGAAGPSPHVLDDGVLGLVRHLPVLAGALDLVADCVLGAVVDARAEHLRGQEEDGEESDLEVEHLDGWLVGGG